MLERKGKKTVDDRYTCLDELGLGVLPVFYMRCGLVERLNGHM